MQEIIIGTNQAGQRFDKFLQKYLPEAGSSFLYKMLRKKNITLNGKKAEGKEILTIGDTVKFFFADETFEKFSGHKLSLDKSSATQKQEQCRSYRKAFQSLHGIRILYEDDNVLILNKPAGILTQKAAASDLSLNEWMIGYLLDRRVISPTELNTFKPSVVNRLDRNTSGIVLCGKSLAGSQALSKLIHDRSIRKFYRTIHSGSLKAVRKEDGYLIKNESINQVQIFPADQLPLPAEEADRICTVFSPLQQLRFSLPGLQNRFFTYTEVELITGKTHQIRAHLSALGYPLIGDYKYGSKSVNDSLKRSVGLQAQLLHAYRLEFPECSGVLAPLSGQILTAPLPGIFQKLLDLSEVS